VSSGKLAGSQRTLQPPHDRVELGVLSDKEGSFIKETVESKATPSPKLLVKDHKTPTMKRISLPD